MRVGEQLLQNSALNKLNRQRATIQNDRKSPTRKWGWFKSNLQESHDRKR